MLNIVFESPVNIDEKCLRQYTLSRCWCPPRDTVTTLLHTLEIFILVRWQLKPTSKVKSTSVCCYNPFRKLPTGLKLIQLSLGIHEKYTQVFLIYRNILYSCYITRRLNRDVGRYTSYRRNIRFHRPVG